MPVAPPSPPCGCTPAAPPQTPAQSSPCPPPISHGRCRIRSQPGAAATEATRPMAWGGQGKEDGVGGGREWWSWWRVGGVRRAGRRGGPYKGRVAAAEDVEDAHSVDHHRLHRHGVPVAALGPRAVANCRREPIGANAFPQVSICAHTHACVCMCMRIFVSLCMCVHGTGCTRGGCLARPATPAATRAAPAAAHSTSESSRENRPPVLGACRHRQRQRQRDSVSELMRQCVDASAS
jgi:hypothetical protein